MSSIFNDHSRFNQFIVTKGLRRRENPDAVRNYTKLQQLRREVRSVLTHDVRQRIITESAEAKFHPGIVGEIDPLINKNDFEEILNQIDTAKPEQIRCFERLFDHDPTWGCIFMKYPRKYAYLIQHLPADA